MFEIMVKKAINLAKNKGLKLNIEDMEILNYPNVVIYDKKRSDGNRVYLFPDDCLTVVGMELIIEGKKQNISFIN